MSPLFAFGGWGLMQSAGGSKACLLCPAAACSVSSTATGDTVCMYIKDYVPCPLNISVLPTKEVFT